MDTVDYNQLANEDVMTQEPEFKSVISISRKGKEIAIWLRSGSLSNRIFLQDIVDITIHPEPKVKNKCKKCGYIEDSTESLRKNEENMPK